MVPPKSCIVLIFDKVMALHACVTIKSIADNYHDNDPLDLVLCIPGEDANQLYNQIRQAVQVDSRINFKLVEITKNKFKWLSKTENVKTRHWCPPIDFYKLFLGSLLPKYDKAIYMDVDTLVVQNIQPILDHPMRNKIMAVVEVCGAEFAFLKSRGEDSHFNNGVMIVDLNWWRDSKIETVFANHLEKAEMISMSTEEITNTYLKPYWSPLPFTFNFYQFSRDMYGIPNFDESNILPIHYRHVILFHFGGRAKPWNFEELTEKKDTSFLGEKWRKLAASLQTELDLATSRKDRQ